MNILYQFMGIVLTAWVQADTYLHYPRGSNNRLNEKSATRATNNRVFDSQNNNRGGYNVGITEAEDEGKNSEDEQNAEEFMASSPGSGKTYMPVRWTSQHGAGGDEDTNPNKLNSNFVIQMMCQDESSPPNPKAQIKNGRSTQQQQYQNPQNSETQSRFIQRRSNNVRDDRVLQEPMEWYDKCKIRDRNKGLFTADQNVNRQDSTGTRQNPNGNRNGYECPEERDYYPYWHPTPWLDVMVYSQNSSMCEYYQKESFNVKEKWECVENWPNTDEPRHYSKHNNKDDCITNGGQWLEFHQYADIMEGPKNEAECLALNVKSPKAYYWKRPINLFGNMFKCLAKPKAPDCKGMPFSRVNHLGNGAGLEELGYDMPLPYFPSGNRKLCVLRTRYNISTDDYDGWSVDSTLNGNEKSPVLNDPDVYFGVKRGNGVTNQPMKLAINTTQFGRTFQDRTHKFLVMPRPATIQADENIKVLSVQGKRGNIVQTYPAVEYDFVPRELKASTKDLIHVLWTGSNTHDNNGNGGDGQTGDDGQGTGGTDRSNMLGLMDRTDNWPLPDDHKDSFLNNMEVKWSAYNDINSPPTSADLGIQLATSGYFKSVDEVDASMQNELNNAPPTFKGAIFKMKKKGTYNTMCTRNNNFSNRSQKGSIVVE